MSRLPTRSTRTDPLRPSPTLFRSVRAKERVPLLRPGNTAYDGRFEVPTLAEIIALAKRESTARRRTISIYPETKHPSYFASIGHPIEARLDRKSTRLNSSQ